MKMVILDGYALNPGDLSWDRLKEFGQVIVYDRTTPLQVVNRVDDAKAIFTNKTKLSRELLVKLPSIKYIGVLATGYDVVDYIAAKELGIIVTNIPSYSTDSVAQMVFALLLEACHHVGEHNKVVKDGKWESSIDFSFWDYPLIELVGKTFGVIGYGSIGRATAKIALAFGMKVITYTRSSEKINSDDQVSYVDLNELYMRSDIISLHCPLTSESSEMINKQAILKMKDGVILINTARGGVINDVDVATALKAGKIAYAVMDVLSNEPPKSNNPLILLENCFVTPHIAWATIEARSRLMDTCYENVKAYVNENPINVINQ
ncbi:MAG: D-2-hydroxyacid dehydrogenase [Clostridiales bacterium]|nr:D-2-hydroxyacid dehydrogenase [Clostridiales bacterium]